MVHEIDPADVAEFVANIKVGKFREAVPDDLARGLWAQQNRMAVAAIAPSARLIT
jgi:ATP-dependent helicase Lhr and Lhr-like helicase